MLGGDEPFPFESLYVFAYRVLTAADRIADGCIARMALVGFPVLAVHEICVDEYFARGESESEDAFGHRKELARLILCVVIVFQ